MAGSTWKWNGGSLLATDPNWTLLSGPGNPSGVPDAGDTAIAASGTIVLPQDAQLNSNTLAFGGTAGATVALLFSGDAGVNFVDPSLDPATTLTMAVPGQATAERSRLDAVGNFVNEGTILAHGPAGSVFTIDIKPTVYGTLLPGYFFNPGLIEADAGNTLIINVGSASSLFNSGSIVASGGTVVINADTAAIAGGVAAEAAFYIVRGGGTLETQASYPFLPGTTTQPSGTTPRYVFGDATAGNTVKIDNLGSFAGSFVGFQAGDTVDLGGSLAVSALAYSTTTGLLELLNAGGTILASLFLNANAMATGTFVVNSGTADGIIVGTGADGDTILTTNRALPHTTGVSGAWQSAAVWNGGTLPGPNETPAIGLDQTAAFSVTTGTAAVAVNGLGVFDPQATLAITSNTTVTPGNMNLWTGTLEVAGGATLTAAALREYDPTAWAHIAAGGTIALTGRRGSDLAPVNGTLAFTQGNSSAAQIAGGTLAVDGALIAGPSTYGNGGNIVIGHYGNGDPTVIVNDGGTITDTYLLLGSGPTSAGTLVLNGPSARWTDMVDPNDTLNARGYALIGYSTLSGNSQTLAHPPPIGSAKLVIQNGAVMTEQVSASIGNSPDSQGTVIIQDGGVWNIADNGVGGMNVGNFGQGLLSVLSGGTLMVGATGTINNVTTVIGGIGVGLNVGSSGTVVVSGAGSMISTLNGITVGRSAAGILSILNGGTVEISGAGISEGALAGTASSGTITVGGAGDPALLHFGTASTGLGVGSQSRGTLVVADGGTVQNDGTGQIVAGVIAGSFGEILVQGIHKAAAINSTNRGIVVGRAGAGYMDVSGLGTVSLTGTNGITVGQSAGATGLLSVHDGGRVSDNSGIGIGQLAGSFGTLSATGGALVENTSTLAAITVGLSGHGTLYIGNGGTVISHDGFIAGANSGGVGTIIVSGAGARLVDTSPLADIVVGAAGTGTLVAQNNNTIFTAGNMVLGGSLTGPSAAGRGYVSLSGTSRAQAQGALAIWPGSTLAIDATSGIAIGASGSYVSGALRIESGHSVVGEGLILGAVADDGLIEVQGSAGTMEIGGPVIGTGGIALGPGASLRLDNSVGAGLTLAFGGTAPAETLLLTQTALSSFGAAVEAYSTGDIISLPGVVYTSTSIVNGNTVDVWNGLGLQGSLRFVGPDGTTPDSTAAQLASTQIASLACFTPGTRIETDGGPRAIETLRPGDRVQTLLGGGHLPIVWIGHRSVNCAAHPRPERVWPVRIAAGAFGPAQPERDLHVSPDHAIYVDGVLVPAYCLINGTTIQQAPRDTVTYYHIELDQHEVILAEGLPTESYLDTGNRSAFANGGQATMLHPDFFPGPGDIWEMHGCAPLVLTGPRLQAARDRLARCETGRAAAA